MRKSIVTALFAISLPFIINSCTTVQGNVSPAQEREMTVGIVQREIKKGMSGADVAEVLGSPNIVTKDAEDNETWVYDKIATEVTQSSSSNGYFIILAGGSNRTVSSSSKQKTLTVVIKYKNNTVDQVTYHSSTF
jgi:outer membrane protein assembly factor BamE (lipoprotein component of BamABCDE complex)